MTGRCNIMIRFIFYFIKTEVKLKLKNIQIIGWVLLLLLLLLSNYVT